MNSEAVRTCPFCAESISVAARVCPRCRQWLRWSLKDPFVLGFLTGLMLLAMLTGLGYGAADRMDRIFNSPPWYSEMPDALQVLEAHLNWVEVANTAWVYVTGLVTNRSAVSWKNIEFECRFFGPDGAMVDAAHGTEWFTLGPQADAAFRVRVAPSRAASQYYTVKVTVNWAQNARRVW